MHEHRRCIPSTLALLLPILESEIWGQLPPRYWYTSAVASVAGPCPPVTRTFPVASKVAVCEARGAVISAAGVKLPLAGSNSSADEKDRPVELLSPPATRTVPSFSKTAV